MSDDLHVYGANCFWHGHISKVGLIPMEGLTVDGWTNDAPGLPCCPHCQGVLYQIEEAEWWRGARDAEDKGALNYVEFLKWTQQADRCWPSVAEAAVSFTRATGKTVVLNFRRNP